MSSSVRRLFREAGRAAAFSRRLERSLEPARLLAAAAPDDWTLLRIAGRLAGLTDTADPFSKVETALARIAVRPVIGEREAGVVRSLDAATDSFGGRRRSKPSNVTVRPRRGAPLAEPNGGQESNSVVRPGHGEARPAAFASAAETGVPRRQRPSAPRAWPQLRSATASVEERAARKPDADSIPLHSVVRAAMAVSKSQAAAPSQPAAASTVAAAISHVSPARAAEIFSERMHASNTWQAFRSVVRLAPSAKSDPQRPASSAVAGTPPDEPLRFGEAGVRRGDTPVDAGIEPARQTLSQPAGSPAKWSDHGRVVETSLSGLRRLAALATESLDAPDPAVEPVRPSQSVSSVEEELDRILRAEALRHGVRTDGLVR